MSGQINTLAEEQGLPSEMHAVPAFCVSTVNVSHTHADNVLQGTMMWLFITIVFVMCINEKSNASPEVSMDVVSPNFSLFFSYLGMQAACVAIIWTRPMVSVYIFTKVSHQAFIREFTSLCSCTWRFMADIMGDLGEINRVGQCFTVVAALL